MNNNFKEFFKISLIIAGVLGYSSVTAQKNTDNTTPPPDSDQISSAEIIMDFQKYIANDQQRLIKIESRSAQLTSEINGLTNQFKNLDLNIQQIEKSGSAIDEELYEKVMNLLDLHLQTKQAIQQQIIILESKISKQKGVVNYITIGQVSEREDSDEKNLVELDSIEIDMVISETQHRKELQAEEDLKRLRVNLIYAKQNLLFVDQLIRLNEEDLHQGMIIKELSKGLLKIQAIPVLINSGFPEIINKIGEDTLLLSALALRISNLENFRKPAVEAVEKAEKKVDAAASELEFLKSPLAPHRIAYWVRFNLPKIGIILVGFFLLSIILRWVTRSILDRMIKRKIGLERTERLETLKVASSSIITIIAVFVAMLVLLSEIGVDLTVVLGGAAVISLVIAFGAQSLVKDFFAGFMILFENQYRVGNIVKINKTIGLVENMSLRLTVLRDLEGISHFIPHGQIVEVSNLTHDWSQVVFDIGVSYHENVDEVMKVITELCTELTADPEFGPLLIGDMTMCGVDKFADSAIMIKFLVKTQPLKQWIIKRELLRRIKNRFDKLGIEIPFPHLTVYNRDRVNSPDVFFQSAAEV